MGAAHAEAGAAGSSSVNVLPCPCPALWAKAVPPCLRATERTMKSPRPLPLARTATLGGNAIEPLEDAFQLRRGDADAVVGHAHGDAVVVQLLELDDDLRLALRVLHRVVEQVPDRGLQLLAVAEHDRVVGVLDVLERLGPEVEPRPRQLDALARDLPEVEPHARAPAQDRSGRAGAQHLVDRCAAAGRCPPA